MQQSWIICCAFEGMCVCTKFLSRVFSKANAWSSDSNRWRWFFRFSRFRLENSRFRRLRSAPFCSSCACVSSLYSSRVVTKVEGESVSIGVGILGALADADCISCGCCCGCCGCAAAAGGGDDDDGDDNTIGDIATVACIGSCDGSVFWLLAAINAAIHI